MDWYWLGAVSKFTTDCDSNNFYCFITSVYIMLLVFFVLSFACWIWQVVLSSKAVGVVSGFSSARGFGVLLVAVIIGSALFAGFIFTAASFSSW